MQNSENKIDKLFRDKLLKHEVVPPTGVWNSIVAGMEAKSRKRRMIWMLGLSSAASLLFAFLAGWYVAVKFPENTNLQANVNPIKTEVPSNFVPTQTSTQKIIDQTVTPIFRTVDNVRLTENSVSSSEKNQREYINIKLLSTLKPFLLASRKNSSNLIVMNSEGFSDSDRAIIAMNTRKKAESTDIEKNSSWAVGVQASPVYRFEQASNTLDSDPLFSLGSASGSPNYVTNISGGIMVELNTGSRFSVQSGVNYGEVSQNSGDVGVSFAGYNWITDRYGLGADLEFGSVQNKANSLSNNMILKTQMGLANIAMPVGASLAKVNVTSNYSPEITRNYNLEQKAGYIEIPLVVRYKVIDSRFDFLVLGGINTNVLMSNNISLANNKEVIANGKTEGLNPLTFSSSVGMGVNYAITSRFRLSVEPTMKIQLNSLSQQTGYNSKPYSVGIFTGISYQF